MHHLYKVEAANGDGETAVYRNRACVDINYGKLVNVPRDGSVTFYQLIRNSIAKNRTKRSMGYREVLGEVEEKRIVEKKVEGSVVEFEKIWKYYQLSEYRWLNYDQIDTILLDLSSGLDFLGLKPGEKMTFYAATSHHWILLAYAAFYKSLTVATVYDTLGEEGLQHGLNQTKSTILFLSVNQLHALQAIYLNCPNLKVVIYTGKLAEGQTDLFPSLKLVSFDQVAAIGKLNVSDPIPPVPEDVAVIMYTSGSTGTPKGVQLTHAMLTCQVSGLETMLEPWFVSDETMIIFLPLAHILAFISTSFSFYYGIKVGFASPRTLFDSSVRHCSGDLVALRPTIMPAVPQIFDTLRKGILNRVHGSGRIATQLFSLGMFFKSKSKKRGLIDKMLDKVLFDKLKSITGGRLRLGICAGAPLSEDTRNFFSKALCTVTQAYGMTEMCGLASIMLPDTLKPCCVGILSPNFDIKLVDFVEGGYFAKDNVGELWVRGSCVTQGYFSNKLATEESVTSDGWLKTGDIVRMDTEGQLYVIDRKKNLVKLSNGEYIALEQLESIYKNSLYVTNMCLFADSHHTNPVAIVQVNLEPLSRFATANGSPPVRDYQELVGRDDLAVQVFQSCIQEAIKVKLNRSQHISQVFLTKTEWTVENQMLNPAMKVNRNYIREMCKDQIQIMYKSQ